MMVDRRYDEQPLRLGVSACVLGKPVRFDGGHKRDTFLIEGPSMGEQRDLPLT